ncbi:hypothetical protein [Sinorhizobium meliloti]|uniref:hypothetical protein n=1 Tax=Rhizobium meliloti TaxID=382 RepID=UPI001294C353|nr:hypothetical protein [Sinorhizobium meliloti]MDW9491747.1 hypothetical protein [Sinorhizobium meliloti]MQV03013.1 hypothetical protein [Sinorhizobium meliloti]
MSDHYNDIKREFRAGGTIPVELFQLVTGKHLGGGSTRQVFEYALDPALVIKYEMNAGSFANVMEWETWQKLTWDKELSKWLAPCLYISPCGCILIQQKTEPLPHSKYPKKIPRLFQDTKYQNWGWWKSRFVCHDYALTGTFDGGSPARLVNADWWG